MHRYTEAIAVATHSTSRRRLSSSHRVRTCTTMVSTEATATECRPHSTTRTSTLIGLFELPKMTDIPNNTPRM